MYSFIFLICGCIFLIYFIEVRAARNRPLVYYFSFLICGCIILDPIVAMVVLLSQTYMQNGGLIVVAFWSKGLYSLAELMVDGSWPCVTKTTEQALMVHICCLMVEELCNNVNALGGWSIPHGCCFITRGLILYFISLFYIIPNSVGRLQHNILYSLILQNIIYYFDLNIIYYIL